MNITFDEYKLTLLTYKNAILTNNQEIITLIEAGGTIKQ